MNADVAIIGRLGAAETAALWRLAARGADVVAYEQPTDSSADDPSSTDASVFGLSQSDGADYVDLLRASLPLWRDLEQETGTSLLTKTGALTIGPPESATVRRALAVVQEGDLVHEVLHPDELRQHYPQHGIRAGEIAVYQDMAGYFRPSVATRAARAAALERGAKIMRQTTVEKLDCVADGVVIRSPSGTHRARHVIAGVGPWLNGIAAGPAVRLGFEQTVTAWFAARYPEYFAPPVFPVFERVLSRGRTCHGFPTLNGTTIALTMSVDGGAGRQAARRVTRYQTLAPIHEFVREFLTDVAPAAVRSTIAGGAQPDDGHLLIGAQPGAPSVTTLGELSAGTFQIAAALGEIAADLALDGRTHYSIDRFSPGRFSFDDRT